MIVCLRTCDKLATCLASGWIVKWRWTIVPSACSWLHLSLNLSKYGANCSGIYAFIVIVNCFSLLFTTFFYNCMQLACWLWAHTLNKALCALDNWPDFINLLWTLDPPPKCPSVTLHRASWIYTPLQWLVATVSLQIWVPRVHISHWAHTSAASV